MSRVAEQLLPSLFDWKPPAEKAFGGATYDPAQDHKRLSGQLLRVYMLMRDSRWRTLAQIKAEVGGSEASVSARLRDLRKDDYGAFVVDRERIDGGLYTYRLREGPK
jgi:hypothetical protein